MSSVVECNTTPVADALKSLQLTTRQKQVLQFLKAFIADKGYPPTRSEIASHFGFKSANAAEDHLRAIAAKGAIYLTKGSARGITVA